MFVCVRVLETVFRRTGKRSQAHKHKETEFNTRPLGIEHLGIWHWIFGHWTFGHACGVAIASGCGRDYESCGRVHMCVRVCACVCVLCVCELVCV